MIEKTDVVIIGAGPVGLFAIFELGLLNISCHVIDNLNKPGGQCAELYPEKPIYDIPSRVSISGQELTDDLLAQAKPFKPVYHLSQQVEKIEKLESNEWLIVTSVNKSIQAKCIVIAAGAGSFVPRKLPIKDIEHLEEKNILYAVRNKSILEGKKLLIVGGGDSALDWTNELSKTSSVTLMHRRKEFKASPDSVSKMLELEKNKKVNFLLGQIDSIEDLKNDKIKVITKNNEETESFEVDYLLPFFGLKMELSVYLRFFFALIFTLSLIGILYWAIKRFDLLKFSTRSSIAKTLIIKETLRIDVRNKLIIVEQDSNEYLILVGQDNNLLINSTSKDSPMNKKSQFKEELIAQSIKPGSL